MRLAAQLLNFADRFREQVVGFQPKLNQILTWLNLCYEMVDP